MRERIDIQRAHDLLEPIVRGDVPAPTGMQPSSLGPLLGVLCWVLEDRNGGDFGCFLQQVERRLAAEGYALGDPLPYPMSQRPARG